MPLWAAFGLRESDYERTQRRHRRNDRLLGLALLAAILLIGFAFGWML